MPKAGAKKAAKAGKSAGKASAIHWIMTSHGPVPIGGGGGGGGGKGGGAGGADGGKKKGPKSEEAKAKAQKREDDRWQKFAEQDHRRRGQSHVWGKMSPEEKSAAGGQLKAQQRQKREDLAFRTYAKQVHDVDYEPKWGGVHGGVKYKSDDSYMGSTTTKKNQAEAEAKHAKVKAAWDALHPDDRESLIKGMKRQPFKSKAAGESPAKKGPKGPPDTSNRPVHQTPPRDAVAIVQKQPALKEKAVKKWGRSWKSKIKDLHKAAQAHPDHRDSSTLDHLITSLGY